MEELMKKLEELNGKLEKAVAAGESVAELRGEIKKLQEEAVAMKAELDGIKKAAPSTSKLTSIPGLEFEKDKFSLMRAVNAIVTRNWSEAGFEKEVFQMTSKGNKDGIVKTMSTEVDSAGGYVVPVQALGDFIELLRANLISKQLGCTYIDGLVGSPVEVPGQAGGATPIWLGEDNASGLTASDLSLKQQQLQPHMCGAIVKVTNRLLRMSNPSIEAMIRQDVAFAIAELIDKAVLKGTGSDAQPLGLYNVPSIPTVDLVSLTKKVQIWNALYDLEGKVEEANALRGKLGYAFHPRVKRYLQQARYGAAAEDGFGGHVASPITNSHLASFIGYPFATTTNLAIDTASSPDETEIVFGNWAEMIVGVWQGLSIMASQEASTAFTTNQTWVRFVQEVDCMVRHKESFVIGQNLSMEMTA
jgi:HK97 family phage major capsid protein